MKFFKSTLSILILCATSPMFAARDPKQTPAKKQITPARKPTSVAKKPTVETVTADNTYPKMFAKIKTMSADQVINKANNTLQGALINSILNIPGLSRTEVEALLQAAVSRHATWSGNQEKDKATLLDLSSQIQGAISEGGEMPETIPTKTEEAAEALKRLQTKGTKPLETAQEALAQIKAREATEALKQLQIKGTKPLETAQEALAQIKAREATEALKQLQIKQAKSFAELYDTTTNLLNPSYLKDRINSIYLKENRIALLDLLRIELFNRMLPEWKKRGINIITFKNKLNDQITQAFNEAKLKPIPKMFQPGQTSIEQKEQAISTAEVGEKLLLPTEPKEEPKEKTKEEETAKEEEEEPKKLEKFFEEAVLEGTPKGVQTTEELIKTELEKIENINDLFAKTISAAEKAKYLGPLLFTFIKLYPAIPKKMVIDPLMDELSKKEGPIELWNSTDKETLKAETEKIYNTLKL